MAVLFHSVSVIQVACKEDMPPLPWCIHESADHKSPEGSWSRRLLNVAPSSSWAWMASASQLVLGSLDEMHHYTLQHQCLDLHKCSWPGVYMQCSWMLHSWFQPGDSAFLLLWVAWLFSPGSSVLMPRCGNSLELNRLLMFWREKTQAIDV